jgi:DNA ligase (NAD+)
VSKYGGEVKSSPRKGLSYLVVSNPTSNSSKANKARELNIPLISEQAFLNMAKGDSDENQS